MKITAGLLLAVVLGMGSIAAHAETRTLQLWTCTLNAGKTPADVQAMNVTWLKFVNSKVKGGDVRSFVLTPVVGKLGRFMFIDSYPNVEAWAAQVTALATPEGVALEAQFNAVSTCTSSSLSSSIES